MNDSAPVIYVITEHVMAQTSMRGSRKFCHSGSNLDNVFVVFYFLFWWGEEWSKYHY